MPRKASVAFKCHCCSGECKKSGTYRNKNRVVQRFFCVRCGKSFKAEQPLDGLRVGFKQACQVVHLLFEGVGIRAISRLTQLDQKTVLNILVSAGEHCAGLLDSKIRNVKVEQVEADEVYSYVGCRPQFAEANDPKRGAFFCFLSLDRYSKLILNFHLGKRTSKDCHAFTRDLKSRLNGDRFQLSTDGYAGYVGYLGAVFQTFKNDVDYGTETKHYEPVRPRKQGAGRVSTKYNPMVCKWVKRTPRIGEPEKSEINTSRCERLNLSLRLFNRRFTRLTLGYSKKIENHRHGIAVFVALHNFVRKHSAHGKTPAQEAGLTDHAWTIEELLSATI